MSMHNSVLWSSRAEIKSIIVPVAYASPLAVEILVVAAGELSH